MRRLCVPDLGCLDITPRGKKNIYIYVRKKERGGERRNRTEGKGGWKGNEGRRLVVSRIAGEIVTNKEHEQKLRTKELGEMKFNLYDLNFLFLFFRYREILF